MAPLLQGNLGKGVWTSSWTEAHRATTPPEPAWTWSPREVSQAGEACGCLELTRPGQSPDAAPQTQATNPNTQLCHRRGKWKQPPCESPTCEDCQHRQETIAPKRKTPGESRTQATRQNRPTECSPITEARREGRRAENTEDTHSVEAGPADNMEQKRRESYQQAKRRRWKKPTTHLTGAAGEESQTHVLMYFKETS